MKDAGLTGVVKQASTIWRGDHAETGEAEFYFVFVEKFPSEAMAARLVASARDAYAEQASLYAIIGPGRTESTMSYAGQATPQDLLVQIRDCLNA